MASKNQRETGSETSSKSSEIDSPNEQFADVAVPGSSSFAVDDETTYAFNDEGQLLNTKTGGRFVFTTQAVYERLGDFVTDRVYDFLTAEPYSLQCLLLSGRDVTSVPRSQLPRNESFIFVSENYKTADTLAVIIHGTGVVRAGQWTRKLIINESTEIGSQMPYIRRCLDNGWAVLVTNTNDNFYETENGKKARKVSSGSAEEHGLHVWNKFVEGESVAEKIIIIAHSYGGVVTMRILDSDVTELERIKVICLTDAIFYDEIFNEIPYIPCRNWVSSNRPLDDGVHNESDEEDEEDEHIAHLKIVSAGTTKHERTSHSAINSIFKFIDDVFSK